MSGTGGRVRGLRVGNAGWVESFRVLSRAARARAPRAGAVPGPGPALPCALLSGLLGAAVVACSALPPASPLSEDLETQVEVVGAEVAELRALPVLADVPAGIQSEDELRASIEALLADEWDEEADLNERAYKLFGMLPPQMDLRAYLTDLYTGQIAGYYDPHSKRFFLKDGAAAEATSEATAPIGEQFVIAHEFTHALQDQHFDLLGIDEQLRGRADQAVAVDALVEGDAMLAALDHLLWKTGLPMSATSPLGRLVTRVVGSSASAAPDGDDPVQRQLRDAPRVIAANLTFPYVEGMAFASAVREEFGQAGLDQAFRDLPDSSEQILHPERYLDRRDRPVRIELADPPQGLRASSAQTLGMLDLGVMLRQYLGTDRAAEGWDGDRFALWDSDLPQDADPEAETLLAWLTVWDRPAQARRFERDYAELLSRKRGDDRFALIRDADVVAVIEGASRERAEGLCQRLLESRIERPAGDRPPPGLAKRIIRWPASLEKLDRVTQIQAGGNWVFQLRFHPGGHALRILGGFLLESERNPDRTASSLAGGTLWTASDRTHAYRAFSIPGVLMYHRRGHGDAQRVELSIGQTLVLPTLFWMRSSTAATEVSLFGVIQTRSGPSTERGERLRLFWISIPWV